MGHTAREKVVSYLLALTVALPIVPMIAAAAFLLAAVAPAVSIHLPWFALNVGNPLITGLFLAIGAWLLAAIFCLHQLTPGSANLTSFSTLRLRLNRIEAALSAGTQGPEGVDDPEWRSSQCEARKHLCTVCRSLLGRGLGWASGVSYIAAWEGVHSAEEALLRTQPLAALLEQAYIDQLRLTGSRIPNVDDLQGRLRTACTKLQSEASAADQREARASIVAVHGAINDFRDTAWSGMVRSRTKLLLAMAATGLMTDLVIVLAIIEKAPPRALGSAAGFFLVAALMGCFSVLGDWAATNSSVEDYGLANARLVMRPLFSGLAGVGGVVLVAMLSPVVTTTVSGSQSTAPIATVTPVAPAVAPTPPRVSGGAPSGTPRTKGATASQGTNAVNTPGLDEIFDLRLHPFSLLLAAIFGLTPSLLIDRLLQETRQYQANLRSSEPTNQASDATPH